MKINHLRNSPIFLTSIILIAGLITGLAVATEYENAQFNHDYLHFGHETLTVKIDDKIVSYTENTISILFYDYVICKLFNDSTGCLSVNGYYGAGASGVINGCQYYTGNSNNLGNQFIGSKELCSSIAIVLSPGASTSASTPSCSTIFNSNGITPQKATTSHAVNTNTVILSASWTASGTTNGIAYICLFPWNDKSSVFVTNNAGWALAVDAVSPVQSVTLGQAISAQWTFSF